MSVHNPHQPHPTPGYPVAQPVYNPPVPFEHSLGGLYQNKMIIISGIPHPNPSRMTFDIEMSDNRDIAFHFDVRFKYGGDTNVIVRNARSSSGGWGPEERSSRFPFVANMFFEIMVLVDHYGYKVAVNNQHLLEFNHRLQPLSRADTLRVHGDVRLTQVRFQ